VKGVLQLQLALAAAKRGHCVAARPRAGKKSDKIYPFWGTVRDPG
jgi:hypothetical protein